MLRHILCFFLGHNFKYNRDSDYCMRCASPIFRPTMPNDTDLFLPKHPLPLTVGPWEERVHADGTRNFFRKGPPVWPGTYGATEAAGFSVGGPRGSHGVLVFSPSGIMIEGGHLWGRSSSEPEVIEETIRDMKASLDETLVAFGWRLS